MKLNLKCVRAVLFEMEKIPLNKTLSPNALYAALEPKYSRDDIDYSVIKLKEADFIKAIIRSYDNRLVILSLDDITNEGHKFLKQLRSDSILNKGTEYIKNKGIDCLDDVFKTALTTSGLLSKVISLFSQ